MYDWLYDMHDCMLTRYMYIVTCMPVWYMYLTDCVCDMYICLIICVCDMCLIMMNVFLLDMMGDYLSGKCILMECIIMWYVWL